MDWIDAGILGIVQGLTEFLPISSTGHLILMERFLGLEQSEASKAFDVVIQFDTLLAVIWYYRRLFQDLLKRVIQFDRQAWHMVITMIIAFLPTAICGAIFHDYIKNHFYGLTTVIYAMITGGVMILASEKLLKFSNSSTIYNLSYKQSLAIGFSQCLAFIPGMSRSMTTILGGRLVGLAPSEAAGFSFLLSIPTLMGATCFTLYKQGSSLMNLDNSLLSIAVGLGTACITGFIVIRLFLSYLRLHTLEVFGWYRIIIGLLLYAVL